VREADGPATGRAALAAVAVVAAAGLVATWARAALSWDGSYFLFAALQRQEPFVLHGRVTSALPQWPVVLASRVTDDLGVLSAVFTAGFAAVPALALLACWVVTRRSRRDLFVWGAIGIGLVTLPGQLFLVSESLAAAQLSWPLVLWSASGAARRHAALAAALAGLVVFLHPVATGFLLIAATVLAALGWRDPGRRTWAWACAGGLAAAAVLRVVVLGGSRYEGEAFDLFWFATWFRRAVWGLPLVAVAAAFVLGVALLLLRRRAGGPAGAIAGAALAVSAAALVAWALRGDWDYALDYRVWGALLTAPFLLLAGIDALWSRPEAPVGRARRVLPVLCALVFAVVLTVQSLQWRSTLLAFTADVGALPAPCAENRDLPSVDGTPLWHWGTRALSLVVQGRAPTRIVAGDGVGCADLVDGAPLPISPHDLTARTGGWFDLRAISGG